jgi:hypothetical protein
MFSIQGIPKETKIWNSACFEIISISAFSYHPIIRRYIVLVTEMVSLNKLQINIYRTIGWNYRMIMEIQKDQDRISERDMPSM